MRKGKVPKFFYILHPICTLFPCFAIIVDRLGVGYPAPPAPSPSYTYTYLTKLRESPGTHVA